MPQPRDRCTPPTVSRGRIGKGDDVRMTSQEGSYPFTLDTDSTTVNQAHFSITPVECHLQIACDNVRDVRRRKGVEVETVPCLDNDRLRGVRLGLLVVISRMQPRWHLRSSCDRQDDDGQDGKNHSESTQTDPRPGTDEVGQRYRCKCRNGEDPDLGQDIGLANLASLSTSGKYIGSISKECDNGA